MVGFMLNDKPYYYFDYAATAPKVPESLQAMQPFLTDGPASITLNANPNSLSTPGRNAFKKLQEARSALSSAVGAQRPDEIIFTSGATEADNAAIFGIAHAAFAEKEATMQGSFVPHFITSALEHDAVLAPAKRLQAQGFTVSYLQPDKNGFISPAQLASALTKETVLVSIQLANSEIGSVQPIKELAALAHDAGTYFHTDAVQALGKIPCNMADLDVDAASFSAHKVGGPNGIGALYLKTRTPFKPFILGGGQERGLRSGTQNVCGAVGFTAAVDAAVKAQKQESARLQKLRDYLYQSLCAHTAIQPAVQCAPGSSQFLPNIVCVLIKGIESQTSVLRFDKLGFAVSGGSACSSTSLEASHVLTACGIRPDDAQGEVRISFGRFTTQDDVEALIQAASHVLDWNC